MSRFSRVRRHARQLSPDRSTIVREHERRVAADPRDAVAKRTISGDQFDLVGELNAFGNIYVAAYDEAIGDGCSPDQAEEIAKEAVAEDMAYDSSRGYHPRVSLEEVCEYVDADPEMQRKIDAAIAHGAARLEAEANALAAQIDAEGGGDVGRLRELRSLQEQLTKPDFVRIAHTLPPVDDNPYPGISADQRAAEARLRAKRFRDSDQFDGDQGDY